MKDYWDAAAEKLRFALSWEKMWEEKLESAKNARGGENK